MIFVPLLHESMLRQEISKVYHEHNEMGEGRKILKFLKYGRENKTFIQIQIQLEEYNS